jgi:copper chaperone CopZ
MATRKIFKVTSMRCSGCVMELEGIEDHLPGILDIRGSYQKQQLEVIYDEFRVTEEQIRQAIIAVGQTPAD